MTMKRSNLEILKDFNNNMALLEIERHDKNDKCFSYISVLFPIHFRIYLSFFLFIIGEDL